jgi:hypothetical protein
MTREIKHGWISYEESDKVDSFFQSSAGRSEIQPMSDHPAILHQLKISALTSDFWSRLEEISKLSRVVPLISRTSSELNMLSITFVNASPSQNPRKNHQGMSVFNTSFYSFILAEVWRTKFTPTLYSFATSFASFIHNKTISTLFGLANFQKIVKAARRKVARRLRRLQILAAIKFCKNFQIFFSFKTR